MDELALRQVIELFRGGLAPQDSVAMRVAAEAGDDVAMGASLRGRVLQDSAQLCRRLCHELLGQVDRSLQVCELLGMPQREEEERLLPRGLEGRVVTDFDAFERQGQRLSICAYARAVPRWIDREN